MTTSNLKKAIWKKFSKKIRLRDSDKRGYCRCITCPTIKHWKEMQAGHWIHGQHPGSWLHERNVHAQCAGCNMFGNGKRDEYALALEAKYGFGVLQEIKTARNKERETWTRTMLYEKYEELNLS